MIRRGSMALDVICPVCGEPELKRVGGSHECYVDSEGVERRSYPNWLVMMCECCDSRVERTLRIKEGYVLHNADDAYVVTFDERVSASAYGRALAQIIWLRLTLAILVGMIAVLLGIIMMLKIR